MKTTSLCLSVLSVKSCPNEFIANLVLIHKIVKLGYKEGSKRKVRANLKVDSFAFIIFGHKFEDLRFLFRSLGETMMYWSGFWSTTEIKMLVIYFLLAALSVMFISEYVYNLFRRNKGNHAFIVLTWFKQFIYSNDFF